MDGVPSRRYRFPHSSVLIPNDGSNRYGFLIAGNHVPLVAALQALAELASRLGALRLRALEPALGALLGHRAVPGDEIAGRVVRAAEEDLAATRAAFGEIPAILRAFDTERDGTRMLALGIPAACHEPSVPAVLDEHR